MTMLCQAGLTPLRGGIPQLGVICNEHSAVEYSLSKDEKTGAVTIRYESPVELPFGFSWTSTIDVDGNVTSTPMSFPDEKTLALRKLHLSGEAADEIGKIVLPGSGLTGIENPGEELKKRMVNVASASLQTYATRSIAGMRTGGKGTAVNLDKYAAAFKEDLERNFQVTIGNGQPLHELGIEKARNAYVEFITDGKVKTYAEADQKTKIKASLLMALSSQGFVACGLKGVSNAFDPNGNAGRLMVGQISGEKDRTDLLNLSKDEKGNIVIKCQTRYTSGKLFLIDEKKSPQAYSTNEGSSIDFDFNVRITDESLEKLAGADWTNFDSDANQQIENDISQPHCIERAADELPDDLKIDVKVDLSYRIDVDRIAEAV